MSDGDEDLSEKRTEASECTDSDSENISTMFERFDDGSIEFEPEESNETVWMEKLRLSSTRPEKSGQIHFNECKKEPKGITRTTMPSGPISGDTNELPNR